MRTKSNQNLSCMVLNVFIAVLNYIGKNNDGNEKVTILWNLILRFSARFPSQENCQGTPIQLNRLRSNWMKKRPNYNRSLKPSYYFMFVWLLCLLFIFAFTFLSIWQSKWSHLPDPLCSGRQPFIVSAAFNCNGKCCYGAIKILHNVQKWNKTDKRYIYNIIHAYCQFNLHYQSFVSSSNLFVQMYSLLKVISVKYLFTSKQGCLPQKLSGE